MNPQALENFIQFMDNYLRVVNESIDELSDEEAEAISQFVQEAFQFIESQKEEEVTIGTPEPIPELPKTPFPSSNINAFKYDPEKQKLWVKFMGKDTADSGPTYSYEGVPNYIVDIFGRGAVGPKTTGKNKYHAWFKGITPSHGAAMSALIKNGPYAYQRVA